MRASKVSGTIQHYFRNTTLHGFKYLCSVHCVDRIGWLVGCCASACCAGVLCAVLWARFLEVPALLVLSDDILTSTFVEDRMPAVAICAPPESVADLFLEKLSLKSAQTKRIPITLARLLTGQSTSKDQLVLLDELLVSNNVTLPEVMMNFTPGCEEYTKRCRFQRTLVPCEALFEKELTYWGMCCVMRPYKLSKVRGLLGQFHTTQMLDLVLQCTHGLTLYGCEVVTYYKGEEWLEPEPLLAGYYYVAQLRFTSVLENPTANPTSLLRNACVHDEKYSRSICMKRCAEITCGCSDPLQFKYHSTKSGLPACPLTQLSCLRAKEYNNIRCQCLPSCKKITTFMVLEPSPITVTKEAIDPLYSRINATPTIVMTLRVNVGHSRMFVLNPTETWLTLLSSLGGVFNMFLGVGLFSALEFLYFLIAKLPVAVRTSSEIDPTARYTTSGPLR